MSQMNITEEQKNQLEQALQLIGNVHYELEKELGDESPEFESVNGVWCELHNIITAIQD